MEEAPGQKFDPELMFRCIVFGQPGFKPFSREDIESDWRKRTGQEPPDYIHDSLEALVERGRLFKTKEGLYQESPF